MSNFHFGDYSVRQSITDIENWHEVSQEITKRWKLERSEIKNFVLDSRIDRLCHFTSGQNLSSIIKFGIASRYELEKVGLSFRKLDQTQKIYFNNMVHVSLDEPNRQMFYKKWKSGLWPVIINLNAEILWQYPFLVVPFNSARTSVLMEYVDKYHSEMIGLRGLKSLFQNQMIRKEFGLKSREATDPQAEILFLKKIEPIHISSMQYSPINLTDENYIKATLCSGFFKLGMSKKGKWSEIPLNILETWNFTHDAATTNENNMRKWQLSWMNNGD